MIQLPVNSVEFYGDSRGWRQFIAVICVSLALASAPPLRFVLEALGPDFEAILVPAIQRAKENRDFVAKHAKIEKMEWLQVTIFELVGQIVSRVPTLVIRSFWGWLFGLVWLVLLILNVRFICEGRSWFGKPFESKLTWLENLGLFVWYLVLSTAACAAAAFLFVVASFCALLAPYWWIFWIVPGLLAIALAPFYYYFALPLMIHQVFGPAYRSKRS